MKQHGNLGRKHTPETIEKIRASNIKTMLLKCADKPSRDLVKIRIERNKKKRDAKLLKKPALSQAKKRELYRKHFAKTGEMDRSILL